MLSRAHGRAQITSIIQVGKLNNEPRSSGPDSHTCMNITVFRLYNDAGVQRLQIKVASGSTKLPSRSIRMDDEEEFLAPSPFFLLTTNFVLKIKSDAPWVSKFFLVISIYLKSR